MAAEIDLSRPRRIHIVGVGGSGMSAIATVLVQMGHAVSGSDQRASPVLDGLSAAGVAATVGHDAALIDGVDAVAVSTAIPDSNPEVAAAREHQVPVWSRAAVLRAVAATRRVIGVAGTHGKTTTSALLAGVLREGGLRPSHIVGGDVAGLGGAAWDEGEWFVVEADESDGTFLEIGAEVAVVTSVEPDHLEHHGSFDVLVEGFRRFLAGAGGPRVVCGDDPTAARLGASAEALTYGLAAGADLRLEGLEASGSGQRASVRWQGTLVGELVIPMPGVHNAQNAAAAVCTGLALGVPFEAAARAVAGFGGVARRFERRGEAHGVTFIDDYAHLPTEVEAMVAAARQGATANGWRRVVVVFQPHRYSRTEALWRDFGPAFSGTDLLVLTDIYPADEQPRPGVTGRLVLQAVLDAHPEQRAAYLPGRGELVRYLAGALRPGDLCLTLGAGDLTTLPDQLIATFAGTDH